MLKACTYRGEVKAKDRNNFSMERATAKRDDAILTDSIAIYTDKILEQFFPPQVRIHLDSLMPEMSIGKTLQVVIGRLFR